MLENSWKFGVARRVASRELRRDRGSRSVLLVSRPRWISRRMNRGVLSVVIEGENDSVRRAALASEINPCLSYKVFLYFIQACDSTGFSFSTKSPCDLMIRIYKIHRVNTISFTIHRKYRHIYIFYTISPGYSRLNDYVALATVTLKNTNLRSVHPRRSTHTKD